MKISYFLPKTITMALSVLAFMLCFSFGGITYAYFVDQYNVPKDYNVAAMSAEVYNSTLSTGNVAIGSQYTSSSTIAAGASATLTIKNTSPVNYVLLRVAYGVKVAGSSTNTTDYTITLVNATTYSHVNTTQTNAGFTAIENGWYYYNAKLSKDQYAPFATFSNTGSNALHVQLNVEVTQASLDVAQNYWNYHSGYNNQLVSDELTVDDLDMTANGQNTINGIGVFIPSGADWTAATSSNSLDAPITPGNNTATITSLTGTGSNNCMRIYNNSASPMILALRMNVQLRPNNSAWSNSAGDFYSAQVQVNFVDNTKWLDIRNNSVAARTFDHNTTISFVSFLYNELVMPGESVYALTNTVSIANNTSTFPNNSLHFLCEVLGYSAAESSWVDTYLAIGSGAESESGTSISVGIDRVPLYYNYDDTDDTATMYSSQFTNGTYTGASNFYSQYARWYNLISSTLT
ncbi:MAG: hypothetical protein IJU58_01120 [Clostridia bacterium]|nr:hypothetical protein [Clostridia bacterium]